MISNDWLITNDSWPIFSGLKASSLFNDSRSSNLQLRWQDCQSRKLQEQFVAAPHRGSEHFVEPLWILQKFDGTLGYRHRQAETFPKFAAGWVGRSGSIGGVSTAKCLAGIRPKCHQRQNAAKIWELCRAVGQETASLTGGNQRVLAAAAWDVWLEEWHRQSPSGGSLSAQRGRHWAAQQHQDAPRCTKWSSLFRCSATYQLLVGSGWS